MLICINCSVVSRLCCQEQHQANDWIQHLLHGILACATVAAVAVQQAAISTLQAIHAGRLTFFFSSSAFFLALEASAFICRSWRSLRSASSLARLCANDLDFSRPDGVTHLQYSGLTTAYSCALWPGHAQARGLSKQGVFMYGSADWQ